MVVVARKYEAPETVRPVEDARPIDETADDRLSDVRLDTVVVASVEVPVTERVPVRLSEEPVIEPRLATVE
jgi:hypothetical protein